MLIFVDSFFKIFFFLLFNRSTVLTSDLANAICDKILKEEDNVEEEISENSSNEKSQSEELVTKQTTPKKSHNKQVTIINNESSADDGTNGIIDEKEKESESVKEEVGAGDVSV